MIFEKQILNSYRQMAYARCDDTGLAFYYSAADFDGLQKESYPFTASAGHTLQGYLYHYDHPISDRLVIFDHGMGGGHRAYLREIETLCRQGYSVLAYDHTGCMESGGTSTNGMAQSLCDLNDCLLAVKKDPRFAGTFFSVIGHSWGAFSTLNIAALHPDVTHVVAISGFVSVPLLVNSFFSGILSPYRRAVLRLETESNPQFVNYHAVETLSNTSAEVLLIYSDNDMLCRKSPHYDTLYASLAKRPNVTLMLETGKGHNPNYTEDAVGYLGEYVAQKNKLLKSKKPLSEEEKKAFVDSFDWKRMTEQDARVWEKIFSVLSR